jgi:DUF917 family protein
MKRTLTPDDIEAAVYGGAILGGGGGGFIEPGLRTARLALQVGSPQLWSVDEFDEDVLSATVALVGAPAAPNALVQPAHLIRALDLLQSQLPGAGWPPSTRTRTAPRQRSTAGSTPLSRGCR